MHDLAFTVSLHAFGLLLYLASLNQDAARVGLRKEEVRVLLNDSLDSLRLIGRNSLMSQKARRCLLRFLDVFDSMSTYLLVISLIIHCFVAELEADSAF